MVLFGKFVYVRQRAGADLAFSASIDVAIVARVIDLMRASVIRVHSDDTGYLAFALCWYALRGTPSLCPWRALSMARIHIYPGVVDPSMVARLFATFARAQANRVQPMVACTPGEICLWNVPIGMAAPPIVYVGLHNLHMLNTGYTVALKPRGGASYTLVTSAHATHMHNVNTGCAFVAAGLLTPPRNKGTSVMFGELLATERPDVYDMEVYDCATIDNYMWLNARCSHADRMTALRMLMKSMTADASCIIQLRTRAMYSICNTRHLWDNNCGTHDGLVFVPSSLLEPILLWKPAPTAYLLCFMGSLYALGTTKAVGTLSTGPPCTGRPAIMLCAVCVEGWQFVRMAPHKLYPDTVARVAHVVSLNGVDIANVCQLIDSFSSA